jgi:sugar phosphate isomerase/epimerase
MESILFTEMFRGRSLNDIASTAIGLGFDGIDFLIRDGHQVEPGNPSQLAAAIDTLKSAGLAVPMATTDVTDPAPLATARIFAACADAGIRVIRLGYWLYDPGIGYRSTFDSARRNLADLARIAETTNVQLAIQLHGDTIHGSGAQAAALLAGHDPRIIGAYPDPGNQVVQDGREDWRFTFDILRPWLCCVGVKNGGWFTAEIAASGQRRWRSDWLGLADGMVPWDDIVSSLLASGYDGLLSFHSHYEVPFAHAVDQTRTDLNYIRRLIG